MAQGPRARLDGGVPARGGKPCLATPEYDGGSALIVRTDLNSQSGLATRQQELGWKDQVHLVAIDPAAHKNIQIQTLLTERIKHACGARVEPLGGPRKLFFDLLGATVLALLLSKSQDYLGRLAGAIAWLGREIIFRFETQPLEEFGPRHRAATPARQRHLHPIERHRFPLTRK